MKNRLICIFFICAFAWALAASAGGCEGKPKCISIDIPEDKNKAPKVNHDVLSVPAGGSFDVELVTGKKARMFFKGGRTPIVDHLGSPVYSIKVKHLENKKLYVKDECGGSCEYQYGVEDTSDPERPVLDPVIIIER